MPTPDLTQISRTMPGGWYVHGQCRLVLVGANLVLQPYQGNRLIIDGAPRELPDAGLPLTVSSLAPSTLYYIYAEHDTSTTPPVLRVRASQTDYVTQTGFGVDVKRDDPRLTLVGMAVTTATGTWADDITARNVLSWFNRQIHVGRIHPLLAATYWATTGGWWLHGQCRLALSGATLLLSPHQGNHLVIDGTPQQIPDAGVALGVGGLAASTTYFIYAYMSGATMTLEASTTTHVTQAGTGVEIKSGDATRTLVGMARTTAGTAWADGGTQRFVLSWFNRRLKPATFEGSRSGGTASASPVAVHADLTLEFLSWESEAVSVLINGALSNNTASVTGVGLIEYDGAVTGPSNSILNNANTAGLFVPVVLHDLLTTLSEGAHTMRPMMQAPGGGTTTFNVYTERIWING